MVLKEEVNPEYKAVIDYLDNLHYNSTSPYTDGYIAREFKRQLIRIFFHIDKLLDDCDAFINDEEYDMLLEHITQKMMNKIKG